MSLSSFSLIYNHISIHFFVQLLDRNPLAILLSFKGSPFGSPLESSVSVVELLSPVLLFDCESRCFLGNISIHFFCVH